MISNFLQLPSYAFAKRPFNYNQLHQAKEKSDMKLNGDFQLQDGLDLASIDLPILMMLPLVEVSSGIMRVIE